MLTATLKQVPAQALDLDKSADKVQQVGGFASLGSYFKAAVARYDEQIALRYRDAEKQAWTGLDWREFSKHVTHLGAAMMEAGIAHGDRVAILSASRYQWTLADFAIMSIGSVTVPIYQSNLSHEVAYVLQHSGAKLVFCEDREQLAKVLEVWPDCPELQQAVLITGKQRDDGGRLVAWSTFINRGRNAVAQNSQAVAERVDAVLPKDMATIVYTSGTTGPPKGVVLTHHNLLFISQALRGTLDVSEKDETLVMLPLAHIFSRLSALGAMEFGYTLAFAESIDKAIVNMQEIRPTFVLSVPRIYEKVYEKVMGDLQRAGRLKKQIFAFAMRVGHAVSKSRQQGKGIPPHLYFSFKAAELLVFNKLKATFGGELRFFVSGGAPLATEIAEFLHAADILVLEGYGLTENVAAANVSLLDSFKFGTVGPPVKGTEQKIADDGELLIRGPHIFREYYKNPEASAEALDDDGWFHTGDIGEFDQAGRLRITDRKKDLIVTSGGKNIAPQNLENQLKTVPFISQVMVYGDKRKYLTALVTLNIEELAHLAKKLKLEDKELAELAQHPEVCAHLDKIVADKNRGLASYESIKKVAIIWPDFEVGEELTPSLKVKRKFTAQKYQAQLDALYDLTKDVAGPPQ